MQGFRQTFEPVPAATARFTALLRSLDPSESAAAVHGSDWNVHEVAAHVLTVVRRYIGDRSRAATAEELRALNHDQVAALHDLALPGLADAIDGAVDALGAVAAAAPLDLERPFHFGLSMRISAAWANLLAELLVHGHDVAVATGRPWPWPAADVEGVWRELLPAAGAAVLRPEARCVDEVWALAMPFGTVTVWIHDGTVTVDDAARPPDHRLAVDDPVAFTLAVPYRRLPVADPSAALLQSRFDRV